MNNLEELFNEAQKTLEQNGYVSKSKNSNKDESYIIDLCDEILQEKAFRQHRFPFLVGDTGRKLPVDAYYEKHRLVVEYNEKQHTESVKFFDNKKTVSGVSRAEQRRIYDQRRQEILPKYNIKLITLSYSDFDYDSKKRIKRFREKDLKIIKSKLSCIL